ncbi:MAG: DNA-binding protein Alba [Candidatus Geothermarchaeales archaeon]
MSEEEKTAEEEAVEEEVVEEVEEVEKKAKKVREKKEANVIFVGKKPVMSYTLAALLQFNAGSDEVVLKARGMSISKAVDVAEVIKRRLLEDRVEVKDIKIDTEILGEDMRNVSTMEIILAKK